MRHLTYGSLGVTNAELSSRAIFVLVKLVVVLSSHNNKATEAASVAVSWTGLLFRTTTRTTGKPDCGWASSWGAPDILDPLQVLNPGLLVGVGLSRDAADAWDASTASSS
jgi:hypothetical protein